MPERRTGSDDARCRHNRQVIFSEVKEAQEEKVMHHSIRRFLLTVATATMAAAGWASTQPAEASSLLISAGASARAPAEVEADYTTSHLFINETANDSIPITVFFNPEAGDAVASAEVFTNLNRRDWATATANGVEEGI